MMCVLRLFEGGASEPFVLVLLCVPIMYVIIILPVVLFDL
jgi:hypothetical protein